jgi:hypothetical protein
MVIDQGCHALLFGFDEQVLPVIDLSGSKLDLGFELIRVFEMSAK